MSEFQRRLPSASSGQQFKFSPMRWVQFAVAISFVWQSPMSATAILKLNQQDQTLEITVPTATQSEASFTVEFTPTLGPSPTWTNVDILERVPVANDQIQFRLSLPQFNSGYFRLISQNTTDPSYTLRINEVMSNNQQSLADEDGDFPDWIELYNPTDRPTLLDDLSLSDDAADLGKWKLPTGVIQPKGYLLVFASGKNRSLEGSPFHTNFKISADGETILLTKGPKEIIDRVTLGRLENDESLGRANSKEIPWQVFGSDLTSPNQVNPEEGSHPYIVAPQFAQQPGRQVSGLSFQILPSDPDHTIHYTTDGTPPNETSRIYQAPFPIDKTTIVRAITFDQQGNRSTISTGTYFFDTDHTLPVISLVTAAENFVIRDGFLYGFGENMYSNGDFTANFPYSSSNAWKDREIPASFELFDKDGSTRFQQDVGIKIFGGWGSRGYPQKSLAIFARSQYGRGKIRHPLFPNHKVKEFESIILRNSGNDNQSTHHIPPRPPIGDFGPTQGNGSYFVNSTFTLFRDAMMQRLASNLNVDTQAYRPSILYLNGEYWGIYNLREKLNEHYVESHHGVPSDQVDLIEGYSQANAGSNRFYREAQSFVRRRDLSLDEQFEIVGNTYINVPSFIDYHLSVIYFQNFDIGNIKQWRDQDGGGFRWMLYDQDYGFNLWPRNIYLPAMARDFSDYDNMFDFYTNPEGSGNGWPNSSGRTQFLRRLLLNESFKMSFITRCLDLLNSNFTSSQVRTTIQTMADQIRPEIPKHLERWSWDALQERGHEAPFKKEDAPLNIEHWERNVQELLEFGDARPSKLRRDLIAHFNLDPTLVETTINASPSEGGLIRVNSIEVNTFPWRGTYLDLVPTHVQAVASEGYEFIEWVGDVEPADQLKTTVTSNSKPTRTITAHFRKLP
ncbi:CotH kinase family protein [bacterium]|jgi:hypothetical protein|nr:hypothetical protein [Verrucomicrobiota bacterium]MDA7632734.1 CotH kinase family protein [bacterium]MDA7667616.1 CotH kinase family protein [bacterium]